jgi:catalase (peroxidase I)
MCGSLRGHFWGPEGKWLADERHSGERYQASPLGAVQMGLIYVNPELPFLDVEGASGGVDVLRVASECARL